MEPLCGFTKNTDGSLYRNTIGHVKNHYWFFKFTEPNGGQTSQKLNLFNESVLLLQGNVLQLMLL